MDKDNKEVGKINEEVNLKERDKKAQSQNNENDEIKLEKRTIEELLKNLREEKNWSYLNVMEELQKVGIVTDEKTIKKWEYGLIYPDSDTIYKLSEIYEFPSQKFIEAKNNSFQKGLKSVHMTFIKWFSYFTGISIKIAYYGLFTIIVLAVFFAIFMISENSKEFVRRWRIINLDFKKNFGFC